MTHSLFDAVQLGDVHLKNRIAMAPLTRNRAGNTIPTPQMATYYGQRASAGLIISEGTPISQQGQGYADVPGLYLPEQLQGWQGVTDAVHAQGGKIFAQLWHVGRVSHTSLQPGGAAPVAPSAITAQSKTYVIDPATGTGRFEPTSAPRALQAQELPGIVADFAQAARNARQCGFDGVEIHGANGYLLDQFLKDGSNQRSDEWGGSIENRARLVLDVVRAVCEAIGPGRVGLRISPISPANGIHESDPWAVFSYLLRALAPLGLAYIHVVEGATGGPRELPEQPLDFAALKDVYRSAGGQALWMVNNGYTREMALQAVASGYADMVAFGRDFIANPDLVERLRQNAPLNAGRRERYYGGGADGYTDYPTLNG